MRDWQTYLHRLRTFDVMQWLRREPGYYARGIYQQIAQKDVFLWAQAIAFKVLITVVPVIVLSTGVLGSVLKQENALDTVAGYVEDFLPAYQTGQLLDFLRRLSDASFEFISIGTIGLLFSAVILFTTLRVAVGNVFQEDWHEDRSILSGYAFDLRMVAQAGLFFLLTFSLTLGIQTLRSAGFEFIEWLHLDYVWIREGWRRTIKTLGLILPFFFTTAMFYQIIYFIPKPHPPRRSALTGTLTASVLWEFAKHGFAIYATSIGRFDYGTGGEGVAKIGEVFGFIIVFVFWVYYSGIVLLIGAIVTLLHEKRHRSRRQAALAEAEEQAPASDEGASLPDEQNEHPAPVPSEQQAQEDVVS